MAYRTRGGRRFPVPPGAANGRQRLVALDGTRAVFECRNGHRMTHDYGKGPIPKRLSVVALRKFAPYWGLGLQSNGTRGHCAGWCQRCQNIADGIAPAGTAGQVSR